jgi:hypothetical protein
MQKSHHIYQYLKTEYGTLFIALIAGLIVSLNVDNQDAQSGVSVITPSNTNTSVDNRAQVTSGNKQSRDTMRPLHK